MSSLAESYKEISDCFVKARNCGDLDAVKFIQTTADEGNEVAECFLVMVHYYGFGVQENPEKATVIATERDCASWLLKVCAPDAADQSTYPYSLYVLAVFKYWGICMEKNINDHFVLLTRALPYEYAPALNALGNCYEAGEGVVKDEAEGFRLFRRSAAQNYAFGRYNLAECYKAGRGIYRDELEALRIYRQAAEFGYNYAQEMVAEIYFFGRGVNEDIPEAIRWYQLAAAGDNGLNHSKFILGWCYSAGAGVEQSWSKAVFWYQKAVDRNYPPAILYLSDCYHQGNGVPPDDAEGCRLLSLIVTKHQDSEIYGRACFRLGVYTALGRGCDIDAVEGLRLIEIARNLGAEMNLAMHSLHLVWQVICENNHRTLIEHYLQAEELGIGSLASGKAKKNCIITAAEVGMPVIYDESFPLEILTDLDAVFPFPDIKAIFRSFLQPIQTEAISGGESKDLKNLRLCLEHGLLLNYIGLENSFIEMHADLFNFDEILRNNQDTVWTLVEQGLLTYGAELLLRRLLESIVES